MGVRARTRDLFAKPYKKHGATPFSRYFVVYKVGDYVDVIVDGSIHKGMPHKFYHGKTGRVFNVTSHAIGVVVNKTVNGSDPQENSRENRARQKVEKQTRLRRESQGQRCGQNRCQERG